MSCVIFDLDGTLIDTAPDIHAAVNEVMAEEGHGEFALHEVIGFIGNGLGHLVKLVRQARGIDAADHERLCALVLAVYKSVDSKYSHLFNDVQSALKALREVGHQLGICTNKPVDAALHVLERYGLSGYFDVVIGDGSLPQRKPDPAPLLAAVEALGGPSVFVGDSEVDEETARRASVPFLLFTEGYCHKDETELVMAGRFSDYAALPELIGRVMY